MGIVTEYHVGPVHPAVDKYRVERFPPFGIAVFGLVPIADMAALIAGWQAEGFELMDITICQRLRASAVVVKDAAAGEAWRKSLGLRIDHPDWLMTGDTGVSSKTIYAVMTSKWHVVHRGRDGFDVPRDADDFGRCYRLIRRNPEWKGSFGKLVAECPAWGPIVARWDELATAFEDEGVLDEFGRPTKATPRVDEILAEIRGGAR